MSSSRKNTHQEQRNLDLSNYVLNILKWCALHFIVKSILYVKKYFISVSSDGFLNARYHLDYEQKIFKKEWSRCSLKIFVFTIYRAAHKRYALKCKFSPDSTMLVTSSADQTAKLWSTADLKLITVKTFLFSLSNQ